MTDRTLDNNLFYRHIRDHYEEELSSWCEPDWLMCIPQQNILNDVPLTLPLIEAHALKQHRTTGSTQTNRYQRLNDKPRMALFSHHCGLACSCFCSQIVSQQYTSALNGESLVYEVTGDDSRVILFNLEDGAQVIVTTINIVNEYLITIKDKVIHLLLVDRLLDNALNQDEQYLSNHLSDSVTSYTQAEQFLRKFRCHYPLLPELDDKISYMSHVIDPGNDVDVMQNAIQDVLLSCWELLLKKHSHIILADHTYQDLLFRALDFYIIGQLHTIIWPQVIERCEMVDQLVKTRLGHLRNANLTSIHLGIPSHYYTPLPAAVVEMASISSRESAVGRLQCLQSSIDLIKAQAKLARVNLHQFKDQDGAPELVLSNGELIALLTTVVVQAQCSSLVSNIYYMTHFVFSVTEDSHLWASLGFLRKSLEQIMKLDVSQLTPISNSMRKELSLQDIMEVSADVESRFERHNSARSFGDITALDLQLHQLTQQIQLSTQALSETSLSERNSPSRRSDRSSLSSSRESTKTNSFREFLASIPSSLRASLRRRQSQQRDAVLSSSLNGVSLTGTVYDKLPDFNSSRP